MIFERYFCCFCFLVKIVVMGCYFFCFLCKKTTRFSLVAGPKVIGFVKPGWATRLNVIGFGLKAEHKSLQHEYKCSFGSGLGAENFEFSKNNDYKPHIKERQWLINEQWKKIIGSDSTDRLNAIVIILRYKMIYNFLFLNLYWYYFLQE